MFDCPGIDGLTVFRRRAQVSPHPAVILITAFAAVPDAVAALKEGAHDYLTKPFDVDELILRVRRFAEQRALERELEDARAELAEPADGPSLAARRRVAAPGAAQHRRRERRAGADHAARAARARSWSRARSTRASPRRGKPSSPSTARRSPRRCSRPSSSATSAAPSPAREARRALQGRDGGTLLLDEVGEMPLAAQAKLLRVLQEGMCRAAGHERARRVDVRVVSATHRDLEERIAEGRFREDLYYRLNVVDIDIPPLRERPGRPAAPGAALPQKFTRPGAWLRQRRIGAPGARCAVPASRATCASWRTPSSTRSCWRTAANRSRAPPRTSPARRRSPRGIAVAPRPLGAALKEFEREHFQRALRRRTVSARGPPSSSASPARTSGRSSASTASPTDFETPQRFPAPAPALRSAEPSSVHAICSAPKRSRTREARAVGISPRREPAGRSILAAEDSFS